ncbi:GTPase HflX [Methylacidiphilum kamchatkense Kam1]|uniref:GTPase HflX n=1 Tax=Methylacidiphilum kamchatkense Kam1 TaxID=1202785 RepID=A0A0C1UT47_9BACT|nr:GTPase HflX [Methylacidiphilum kamchatkense]KIE58978.1 GTPase HflX [Methylacidiphilum kamchatkense Kam1]QDQ43135.1 GTP-binding protein HflX [Methylacidiphilum kamchatkense Kam1]
MISLVEEEKKETGILVGLDKGEKNFEEAFEELEELAISAGGLIIDRIVQRLSSPTAPFYIGKGKAKEIAEICKEKKVSFVLFNDDLSPIQCRNLSSLFGCKVLDRTQLILDIFAQRAKTREGKLQIELAQLLYLLPRLTRLWTHLSRQTGGIGTRGPGETQLEVDRRRIQEKIHRLKKELEEVKKTRYIQRSSRQKSPWPTACLVGYTNAGKSTLFNLLTNSKVLVENKLFATLDPTIRLFEFSGGQKIFLSDTVGFIQKLPFHLVESFKATLEEVKEADLLIHLVDISHPLSENQIEEVNKVLEQLGALDKPTILVWNKIDLVKSNGLIKRRIQEYPGSVPISAATGVGCEKLLLKIEQWLKTKRRYLSLKVPVDRMDMVAKFHRVGFGVETDYQPEGILVNGWIPLSFVSSFEPFNVLSNGHEGHENGNVRRIQ